jgi:hypothetical protein
MTIDNSATITSDKYGILARNVETATVTNSGAITGTDGIRLTASGAVKVTNSAAITATRSQNSSFGYGIDAESQNGRIEIDAQDGDITANTVGIGATSEVQGDIIVRGGDGVDIKQLTLNNAFKNAAIRTVSSGLSTHPSGVGNQTINFLGDIEPEGMASWP